MISLYTLYKLLYKNENSVIVFPKMMDVDYCRDFLIRNIDNYVSLKKVYSTRNKITYDDASIQLIIKSNQLSMYSIDNLIIDTSDYINDFYDIYKNVYPLLMMDSGKFIMSLEQIVCDNFNCNIVKELLIEYGATFLLDNNIKGNL